MKARVITRGNSLTGSRIWINSLPCTGSEPIPALAIERSACLGPMTCYGLLAGARCDSQSGTCLIAIPNSGAAWRESMREEWDEVTTGIEEEYLSGIRAGTERALQALNVGWGMEYRFACHAAVGSSWYVFASLAIALTYLHQDLSALEHECKLDELLDFCYRDAWALCEQEDLRRQQQGGEQ